MRQILMRTAVLAVFVAGVSAPGQSQPKLDLDTFFMKNIGLSQEQVADIRNGQAVAKDLESRVPDEIFVFGAIYINAEPEKYVSFANDLDRLRKLSEFLAIGTFSSPPQVSDLKGFALTSDDIAGGLKLGIIRKVATGKSEVGPVCQTGPLR